MAIASRIALLGALMSKNPQPVHDYATALWWLLQKMSQADIVAFLVDGSTPPLVCELVCDTHWINPAKLRRDMRRKLKEIGQ